MASNVLKKLNYQIGRICRLASRRIKLMAVNNQRKQQLRHLGERIYILKTLQQDDDIWEKDEIAQLMLTIADFDQEIEMIIEEIHEIKAEIPLEELAPGMASTANKAAATATVQPAPADNTTEKSSQATTADKNTAPPKG